MLLQKANITSQKQKWQQQPACVFAIRWTMNKKAKSQDLSVIGLRSVGRFTRGICVLFLVCSSTRLIFSLSLFSVNDENYIRVCWVEHSRNVMIGQQKMIALRGMVSPRISQKKYIKFQQHCQFLHHKDSHRKISLKIKSALLNQSKTWWHPAVS